MPREKMVQVGFRFPETLVNRLDALVELANAEHPGQTISRSDLARGFLLVSMDLAEAKEAGRKKRGA